MTREQVEQILDNSIFTKSEEYEWVYIETTYCFGRTTITLNDNYVRCFFYQGNRLTASYTFFYYNIAFMSIKKVDEKNAEIYISKGVHYISK